MKDHIHYTASGQEYRTYVLEAGPRPYAEVTPANVAGWTEDGLLNYIVTRQLPEAEAKALYAGWSTTANHIPASHPRFEAHWGQFRLMLTQAGWTGGKQMAFTPPPAPEVDPDSERLNAAVLAHMGDHPHLSYAQALKIVAQAPEMKATIKSYTQPLQR